MSDSRKNKIVGTWQIVPIAIGSDAQWIFSDDNKVSLIYSNDTNIIEGTYDIELKQARYYLNIYDFSYLNGKYLILKQNNEILVLQRIKADYSAAFLRKEFVKL